MLIESFISIKTNKAKIKKAFSSEKTLEIINKPNLIQAPLEIEIKCGKDIPPQWKNTTDILTYSRNFPPIDLVNQVVKSLPLDDQSQITMSCFGNYLSVGYRWANAKLFQADIDESEDIFNEDTQWRLTPLSLVDLQGNSTCASCQRKFNVNDDFGDGFDQYLRIHRRCQQHVTLAIKN